MAARTIWAATMDVGDWLRSLGLGQYLALFREHEINAEVLPELTEADLEKFGVPFGHRKRLIKAIAKLGTAMPERSEAAPPLLAAPLPDRSAERRHITVMFCDLVGSTSISAQLDAEDWRNLASAYLEAASAAVTQMGGHVAKSSATGSWRYSDTRSAQENNSERAVRAALAIQRALAELNAKNAGSGRRNSSPASALKPARSWWSRPARCSATRRISQRGFRRWPSRERSWSPRACSVRSRGCSSPRTAARKR